MIRVENLTFTYPGAAGPAVRDLSFTVEPGEIFGFLGPSGAGKSTTQKILIGLLRGYRGRAEVLGRELHAWRAADNAGIGVGFELPNHFLRLTALENLRYFQSLYPQAGHDPLTVLDRLGLAADAHTRVSEFSKGMKSRLNLARALLHDPRLLYLDEPTSGLDPVNAHNVRELIRAQRDVGKTVFLTTHNMILADELCDRVAFLVDGAIRLIDSPRALRLQHGKPMVRVESVVDGALRQTDFPLDDLGANAAFLAALQTGVQTIHTQEATLDDIFRRVTGRSLQ